MGRAGGEAKRVMICQGERGADGPFVTVLFKSFAARVAGKSRRRLGQEGGEAPEVPEAGVGLL